jgi:hypothetical protein
MSRVCWLAKELLASHLSSQSVRYPSLGIQFPFLVFTEEVLFLCTHKHRTLTILSSIMQNFSSSLCTTILELTVRSCRIFSKCNKVADNNLTQFKTMINVSERKHTDHIHVIKNATLHTVTHAHFYQALTVNNDTIKCE